MDPDVQVQEPVVTPDVSETQPIDSSDTVSEDVKDSSDDNAFESKGDLRIPLKQEREARRQLEANLKDPAFIAEQARALGITDEDTQDAPDTGSFPATPPMPVLQQDPYSQYKFFSEMEKAQDKYPELQKDEELQVMVSALINRGMNPIKAADKVFARFTKVQEQAKAEGASQAKAEISDKERAQTMTQTTPVNSDATHLAELQAQAKSKNPKIQQTAMIELLKLKNKR